MADQFEHISSAAVKVPARLAAKKQLTEQLRQQGVRQPLARPSAVSAHLAEHPELYEQALATAWELAVRSQSALINAVLFEDDRRVWRKPRRPVYESDNTKSGTEKTQLFPTTSAIFSGWRLLNAY
jgi:hypothetical protein